MRCIFGVNERIWRSFASEYLDFTGKDGIEGLRSIMYSGQIYGDIQPRTAGSHPECQFSMFFSDSLYTFVNSQTMNGE